MSPQSLGNEKSKGFRPPSAGEPSESKFLPKRKASGRKLSQQGPNEKQKPTKKGAVPSYSKRRKPAPKPQPLADSNAPMRLNRFVAQAGICSRREADVLIAAGVVSVNGEIITEMGYRVQQTDKVQVEGDTIKAETKRYVLLNKPKNFLATADDPGGRRTVMQLIKGACKERVYPVGRLDKDTTGLLLLTNDGEMAKRYLIPRWVFAIFTMLQHTKR